MNNTRQTKNAALMTGSADENTVFAEMGEYTYNIACLPYFNAEDPNSLISIGLVSEDGRYFYAEACDYILSFMNTGTYFYIWGIRSLLRLLGKQAIPSFAQYMDTHIYQGLTNVQDFVKPRRGALSSDIDGTLSIVTKGTYNEIAALLNKWLGKIREDLLRRDDSDTKSHISLIVESCTDILPIHSLLRGDNKEFIKCVDINALSYFMPLARKEESQKQFAIYDDSHGSHRINVNLEVPVEDSDTVTVAHDFQVKPFVEHNSDALSRAWALLYKYWGIMDNVDIDVFSK